ncbi:MAG: hypothetical protein RAP70_11370 [Candidatus Celaenobacter antarcticus]|nr:hypothetical protein [Candidatus Celaenobacter antarcticus]
MKTKAEVLKKNQLTDVLLVIAVLGSLWGLSEVVLSGAIRMTGIPFRAGILAGIGIGLIAVAVGAFMRMGIILLIPIIAVLCKQLVVPILGVSVMCKVNSCVAVMLEGFAVTGVVYLARRKLAGNRLMQIACGTSAALLAAGIFYFAGMRLAPCNYLLSFNRSHGFVSFMAVEGLVWAAFSAVLFPLGYRIGVWLRDSELTLKKKSLSYYIAAAAIVVGSWTASAFAIAAGF